ncbi:MAG TPA: hypothetical protein QF821_00190 [Candidatus Thalassarchaeaceae archaeon]|jgi:hypothetical protein|nr:hypothetical protein [Candidatus Thalassarchaeaceae archaeon]
MSEGDNEWVGALMRPSITLSAGSFIVGVWMAFLTIINILFGAYSNGRKVNWIDFIGNGEITNSAHEIGITIPDDLVFGLLSSVLIAAGVKGISAAREDDFMGWVSSLHKERMVASLSSTQSGLVRTVASWMVFSGVGYYLIWSSMESTWVDPGVYSVMISFVALGIGIHWILDAGSKTN